MNKFLSYLIVIIFVLLKNNSDAQHKDNYFLSSFTVGSSLTFRNFNTYFQDIHEYTWNFNTAVSLNKHFFLGIQVLNIFIDYKTEETERYNIFGSFLQYNITPFAKFHPFAEISLNKGNYYYPSDSYYPENEKTYYYTGIGGGIEMPLIKNNKQFFVDLSFIFYLQKINSEIVYDYNQYIIGLNYHFGKSFKKY